MVVWKTHSRFLVSFCGFACAKTCYPNLFEKNSWIDSIIINCKRNFLENPLERGTTQMTYRKTTVAQSMYVKSQNRNWLKNDTPLTVHLLMSQCKRDAWYPGVKFQAWKILKTTFLFHNHIESYCRFENWEEDLWNICWWEG